MHGFLSSFQKEKKKKKKNLILGLCLCEVKGGFQTCIESIVGGPTQPLSELDHRLSQYGRKLRVGEVVEYFFERLK
jgi:hypothetical protein